jgi:hypothetical protein
MAEFQRSFLLIGAGTAQSLLDLETLCPVSADLSGRARRIRAEFTNVL